MTGSHQPLTDQLIRPALTELAAGPDAGRLQDEVLRAVDVMPQARTSRLGFGSRRTALVLVAAALLLAALASAVALASLVLRTTDFHLAYGLDGDIFVAEWDGRNPVLIADGLADAGSGPTECGGYWGEGPMWSPDGRHLAYRSATEGCPGRVYISNVEGQVVASFPGTGWLVAWSPDSTRVATWVELSQTIGIYGLDGARQALLRMPDGFGPPGDYDPAWSPDGRSLLMRLAPPQPSQVWEFPVDGGSARRVPADDPRSHWDIAFSPDGARAAFADGESLVVIAADGTSSQVVASGLELMGNHVPLWSPIGDQIAFSWTDDPHDVDSLPHAHEIRVLDVPSGTVTTLFAVRGSDPLRAIAFSPDGDRILFSRPDSDALWSVKVDGSDAQPVVTGTRWGDWQWQPGNS